MRQRDSQVRSWIESLGVGDDESWSGRLMVLKDWSHDSNVFFRARMFEIRLLIQSGLGDSVLVARSISSSSGGTRKARSSRKFTLAERVDIARTGRPPESLSFHGIRAMMKQSCVARKNTSVISQFSKRTGFGFVA